MFIDFLVFFLVFFQHLVDLSFEYWDWYEETQLLKEEEKNCFKTWCSEKPHPLNVYRKQVRITINNSQNSRDLKSCVRWFIWFPMKYIFREKKNVNELVMEHIHASQRNASACIELGLVYDKIEVEISKKKKIYNQKSTSRVLAILPTTHIISDNKNNNWKRGTRMIKALPTGISKEWEQKKRE